MAPLVVELDGERRSLPAEVVREVLRLADLTPVPSAPPAVCGLSQLRGQIVPVVDPTCLADARWPSTRRRRGPARLGDPLVLVEAGGVRAALLVDRVLDERAEGVATEAARALDPAELFASLRASIAGRPSPLLARSRPSSPWFDPAGGGLSAADVHQLRAFFFDEAAEHLDAIDRAVLALERSPSDPGAATALLRELHTLKGSAGSVALHELARLAHAVEDRVIALGHHPAGGDELRALVASVEHLRVQVAHADRPSSPALPPLAAAGGEPAGMHESSGSDEPAPSIRVEVDRVDALMEAVAELVQDRTRIARQLQEVEECVQVLARAQGTLDELARPGGDPRRLDEAEAWLREVLLRLGSATQRLASGTDGLRHTSRVLQDGLQRMRMMEVGRLFARIAGPARELARRSGREVEVRTTGEATAIDKAIVERIAEPLLHLVRNAVAHGIEPPEVRAARGKPPVGRLELSARQRGDQILIEVSDDGAGVDVEGVRRALARSGRLSLEEARRLDEAEVVAAIFEPGVSTRADADDLAGRGVGLDAVKETIARLGGVIGCSSTAGRGSRFTVRLPLTTAIARALLFKVGGQVYAVPANNVLAPVEGAAPPTLLRLEPVLATGAAASAPASDSPTVALEHEGARFAITCDKLIGEREVVIKGLGPLLSSLPLYAGATISGAGKVQLILDVAELASRARSAAPRAERERAPRVLVVDDSRSVRQSAARALERAGFAVDLAADGEEAWARLGERCYDLVVTDLEMPRLDGWALLERLRADRSRSAAPIVVMSSRAAEARERSLAAGAVAFFSKPLTATALVDGLRALLPVPARDQSSGQTKRSDTQ